MIVVNEKDLKPNFIENIRRFLMESKKPINENSEHNSCLFKVTRYDSKNDPQTTLMARSDVLALDLESYDLCLAEVLDKSGFIYPKNNKWKRVGQNGYSIGDMHLRLLKLIMTNPGIYFDRDSLKQATGFDFDPDYLAGVVFRLRRAFHETKATQNFILTSKGMVSFPVNKTWIMVGLAQADLNRAPVVDDTK